MSDNTLKIEVVPNGFLYFEPMGYVRDGMQFIATAKRNSSQDAKVADWFEGTKKQGQSRDFKSVMHTALAACDAVNGGKDKWKVFRAIENYQKSHNLTITVQPKGQNKGNNQNKSQSLADRVKAVDWSQDNMVIANFRKLFGIISDQDLEMKMPTRDAGYDARGIAQFEATYTYNGKQYLAKMSGKKKEARKAVIYKILADQFGIGQKEPEVEISKPKTADVDGFKEFIQENLRDTDCRLWFRGIPEEYGMEPSWRYDPQKRVRRSDGGWAQVNSATLYLTEKGKQYRFEGLGQSSKDAENAAILKMAKEFCNLDVKAKIAEETIEELQEDGNYDDLKYLKVLEEREDIYFNEGPWGKYYVKTPYGDIAFFENDDVVDGMDSRLWLRNERDVTPDMFKYIKVSKEEEAKIQRDINARVEEIIQETKDYLIEHKRELNYLMILDERSDVSYWSSLGEYAVNIDGGRTFYPGFKDVSYLKSYLPILRKQNPEMSEVLEAIKISDEEKKEISQDIDTRVNSVIEQVKSEKDAKKAFEDFNDNVKAGNVKAVEEYFANGGELSNEFDDETLRLADSPEMIKLLIKNGAEIVTDNEAYDDDNMEYHSFLVDAIDEVRPDKVAAYLQEGADANFDATDYYYSEDQSVNLALERIQDNEDTKSVTIIKQMIEDARNGKPREEIRLENYQKGAEKQEQSIEKTAQQAEKQEQSIEKTVQQGHKTMKLVTDWDEEKCILYPGEKGEIEYAMGYETICKGDKQEIDNLWKEADEQDLQDFLTNRFSIDVHYNSQEISNAHILIIPIVNNDFDTFLNLLDKIDYFNSSTQNPFGYSNDDWNSSVDTHDPLIFLIKNKEIDEKFVEQLIEVVPQTEFSVKYRVYSYLSMAIEYENFHAAKLLVRKGADTYDSADFDYALDGVSGNYDIEKELRMKADFAIKTNNKNLLQNIIELTQEIVDAREKQNYVKQQHEISGFYKLSSKYVSVQKKSVADILGINLDNNNSEHKKENNEQIRNLEKQSVGETKMNESNIEFVGAMDNPHFMERHFNKEAITIGSKPLPRASEDEMREIMETLDKRALSFSKEQSADKVLYLSMELDHNIATDAVVPTDCVEQGKIFTITRDAGTPYEKDVRVVLISKEDMQKEAGTNLIHAIYGPDEGKFVNYTAFFGAMAEAFPRELPENATPEQIAQNEKCKEYWDKHVFLATPEEVGKVVKDLQQATQNTELSAEKKQKYATVISAASMRINVFKNVMRGKSPLIKPFHAKKADYEISVPQPKGNDNTRSGKGIGE